MTIGRPETLMFLFAGVCMGLSLGIIPGIGGVAGTAMLLPFTFAMDQASAIALLLGLAATTTTADPISAITLGAPGHSASAATALDGYPMTKRGEGGRALGAAYMSALMGGLFGALLMGVAIPVIRPAILFIGSPELLALSLLGLSMVSVLSGSAPLRGLTMACAGIMLSLIGQDPQTATLRWTLGTDYLFDRLPLVPLTLGIFALPELCDLAVGKKSVTTLPDESSVSHGLLDGAKDCFRHWFLVLRCSWIGSLIGAIPGISASVIDWISYGHALKTEKGAADSFGKGDVRGVISAESATNSREGGALVPTIVFGVPGSAGMAILLGAFMMHGIVPGPQMLTTHLATTYSMVWSIAIANVLGSGLCFLLSGQFAKLATLRYSLILPVVLCFIFIGAFEGQRSWGDLISLLVFGLFGWLMKHLKWPRPPLVLGYILGSIVESDLFISLQRYGAGWVHRPIVAILLIIALICLVRPLLQSVKARGGAAAILGSYRRPKFRIPHLFYAFLILLLGAMVYQSMHWAFAAKVVPLIVGLAGIGFCCASMLNDLCIPALRRGSSAPKNLGMHMDVTSQLGALSTKSIALRGLAFFGWLLAMLGSMAMIGLIPTVPLFVIAYMRIEGRERWRLAAVFAIALTIFIYVVFDRLLAVPWPGSVVGDWFPVLRNWVPST
ncbi:hypothetical protein A9R05_41010 (plasmid) [Burkholderia sp. KK1]|nr:hypothetical protein A9R05_41010 [Burkholderia sp. KK1]